MTPAQKSVLQNKENIFINKAETPVKEIITYKDYFKEKTDLKKYKIPELKVLARHYKLYVTGTKPILIERIETYFNQIVNAIKIQRVCRGFFVRFSLTLRGAAFKNIKKCVNETDFYTLEPLAEIPKELFFSYTDATNFTYGFNVNSLITLYKKKGRIRNPYNREQLSNEVIQKIFSLYKIITIVFPVVLEEDNKSNNNIIPQNYNNHPRSLSEGDLSNNIVVNNTFINILNDLNRVNTIENHLLSRLEDIRRNLTEIRSRPISQRIIGVFMEIDLLGNYTESAWFANLEKREYYKYYATLYDIWGYRARMSFDVKRKICPLGDPFTNIFNERIIYENVTIERLREACITIIENMVYTGEEDDFRKLGALHVLTALTVVSIPARNNMIWLYESLY